MNKQGKTSMWVILGVVVVGLIVFGVVDVGNIFGQTGTQTSTNTGNPATFQPTASYATTDKFSTANVIGTSYYKKDGQPVSTTAITNTEKGVEYTYWVDNSSQYYVRPHVFTAGQTDNVVNKNAWSNSTAMTINVYDLVNRQALSTSSVYNTSVGASGQAKYEITILGAAKQATLPFGGVMVVEYNNSFSSVSCSGDGVVGLNSKYQVTYTPTATTNAYKVFELADGFDVSSTGSTGVTKVIKCEFQHDTTDEGNSAWYLKTIPANYYVGNDGGIYLDTEEKANGLTTRTGLAGVSTTNTFYFS